MLLALLLSGCVTLFYFFLRPFLYHNFRFTEQISASTKPFRHSQGANTKWSKTRNLHDSECLLSPMDKGNVVQGEAASSSTLARQPAPNPPIRIIVAMTGATGSVLGVRLLQTLRRMGVETHLVVSRWAAATLAYETEYTVKDLKALATRTYSASDVAAPISSGSFCTKGMIIVPCSMKTLSAVAMGFGEDLITRAADVVLKERRRLVVVARETPLNGIHLRNMMTITNNGGIIFPPVPAFYTRPQTVEDIIAQSVGRMLDMFDLDAGDFERWSGM